jgi:hypothetical protein
MSISCMIIRFNAKLIACEDPQEQGSMIGYVIDARDVADVAGRVNRRGLIPYGVPIHLCIVKLQSHIVVELHKWVMYLVEGQGEVEE